MPVEETAVEGPLREAIRQRYVESRAVLYGISEDDFERHVGGVLARFATEFSDAERLEVVAALHVEELALARACTAGNAAAWDEFVARFRSPLHAMAVQITREGRAGDDLAGELYAELYGIPNREGRRVSKLDYYMGRGSLQGWLRTVLAQKHVDRCRASVRTVSLEEKVDAGVQFVAKEALPVDTDTTRITRSVVQALATLSPEERFVLASYYLDRRRLADIGRQLGVHESTISRKLDRAAAALRKVVRRDLQASGMTLTECEQLMTELDVRDLDLDFDGILRQERSPGSFKE